MKTFYKIYNAVLLACLFIYSSSAQNPSGNWTITGPTTFPTNISGQIHGIGRVVQMKFHPQNTQKIYAVSASGGLWISTNGGSAWNKTGTDNQLPQTPCASVCIDYTNDNILYLSTGDANYYSDSYGMYKSTDGGVTWFSSSNGLGTRMAIEILMHPFDHNTLIAATTDGIWKTTDGGNSWVNVKSSGAFKDMVFQPGSSTIMYAVDDATFWRSSNSGNSWAQIISVNPSIGNGGRIAVTAANSNTVYAAFVGTNDNTGKGGIIYRSTDGGLNFSLRKGDVQPNLNGYEPNEDGQGNYNWCIFADRNKANTVYVGGHVVWKSTNGGSTWTKMTNWYENCHTDMHQMITSPDDNTRLFNANDGGIFLSTDGGANWVPFSDGLSATEVYHMGQSNLAKDIAGIGTQDNGELFFNVNTWYTNRGGDFTSKYIFDYGNANTAYYTDDGSRRDLVANGAALSYGLNNTSGDDRYALTSQNTQLAYASQGALLKRTAKLLNASPKWKTIKTFGTQVKAVAVSPANTGEVYVVLDNQEVYFSSNGTANNPVFNLVSTAAVPTDIAANILVNKSNPSIVYMTCGSRVYRSANKAVTWTDISGSLPYVNIIDIVHDPNTNNESFYLASSIAVYYRNKNMSNWQSFSKGLPSVAGISNLRGYFDGSANSLLRVSFYGRGVWQTPLYNKTGGCTNVQLSLTLDSYPEETKWNIKDAATGVIVAFGGPYAGFTGGSTVNETVCLPNGCYEFNIFDVYGDGICCAYGNGSYSLTTGIYTIAQGGTFGTVETTPFCIPFGLSVKKETRFTQPVIKTELEKAGSSKVIKIYPNPATSNTNIVIRATEQTTGMLRIADAEGNIVLYRKQELQKGSNTVTLDTRNFAAGIYYVVLAVNNKMMSKKLEVIK